eukprot:5219282-Alexandrium_andersonii.AAC.1
MGVNHEKYTKDLVGRLLGEGARWSKTLARLSFCFCYSELLPSPLPPRMPRNGRCRHQIQARHFGFAIITVNRELKG